MWDAGKKWQNTNKTETHVMFHSVWEFISHGDAFVILSGNFFSILYDE